MYVWCCLLGLLICTEGKILWYLLRQKAPSSLEKVARIKNTRFPQASWHYLSLMRLRAKGVVHQLCMSLMLHYSPSWQHSHKDVHFSTKSWFAWDPYLMLLWLCECYHVDLAVWVLPKLFPVLLKFWMLGGGKAEASALEDWKLTLLSGLQTFK